jgi:hypothetical protein
MQQVVVQIGQSQGLFAEVDQQGRLVLDPCAESTRGFATGFLTPLLAICATPLGQLLSNTKPSGFCLVPLWNNGPCLRLGLSRGPQMALHNKATEAGAMALVSIAFQPGDGPHDWAMQALVCEMGRRLLHDMAQPVQAIYAYAASLERSATQGDWSMPEKPSGWLKSALGQIERLVLMIKEQRNSLVEQPQSQLLDPRPAMTALFWQRSHEIQKTASQLVVHIADAPELPPIKTNGRQLLAALWLHSFWRESEDHWPDVPVTFGPWGSNSSTNALSLPLATINQSVAHSPTGDSGAPPSANRIVRFERRDWGLAEPAIKRLLGELGAVDTTDPSKLTVKFY